MAQSVNLWGATYSDVPALDVPKTGGGTARFTDTTPTTAIESDVASGKVFIKADGSLATGTGSGGGGGSVTQDANGYIVLPSTGGGSPSATQHTIYFEFTDSTDTTINAWYDSSFISDAITATTPTTYGQKTVTLAQLDGVTWYSYTPSQWTTIYDGTISISNREFHITSVAETFTVGDVYRITIDNTQFTDTVFHDSTFDTNMVGNVAIIVDWASTGDPVVLYNVAGYVSGNSYLSDGSYTFKLEKQGN